MKDDTSLGAKTYALPILFLGGIGVENGFECWSSEMEIGIVKWEKRLIEIEVSVGGGSEGAIHGLISPKCCASRAIKPSL